MTKVLASLSLLSCLALLSGCGDDDPPPACDAATLGDRLEGAGAGDTVEVGACRVQGSFRVPAGVTLKGAGRDATVLVGPEGEVALTLDNGPVDSATVAVDLSIESGGRVGLLASGAGNVVIERVDVRATRGVALAVADAVDATIRDVNLQGPVTIENALRQPAPPAPDEDDPEAYQDALAAFARDTAPHGLVVVAVADATLEGITAHGFAQVGALIYDSHGRWTGGEVSGNLGLGLAQFGGDLVVEGVSVTTTLKGSRLLPPFGVLLADDASFESTDLVVADNESQGIVQIASTALHTNLTASGNGETAIFVQDATALTIEGGELSDNALAGIIARDSTGISLHDLSIRDTRLATTVVDTGSAEVGDGIQLTGSTDDVDVDTVTLSGNQRAGLLIDLHGGTGAGVHLAGLTVDGTGDQYGVIAQDGTPADGWDEGVTRLGATVLNDASFLEDATTLGLAGRADVPLLDEDEIRGVIGPND